MNAAWLRGKSALLPGGWRDAAHLGAWTAVYFLAGKVGLSFAVVHSSTSVIWPPTGIAMAAFLIMGSKVWPAILLGAFLVNVTTAGAIVPSLSIAIGNTLEGMVAALLINRFAAGPGTFDRGREVFTFVVLAGLVSTSISAIIGAATLVWSGLALPANFGAILITWWLGDAVGAMTVTPLLVLWWRQPRIVWPPKMGHAELLSVMLLVSVTTIMVFADERPLAFLLLPPVAWVAFRFGPREVATALAVVALLATIGTVERHGPFAVLPYGESLLILQAFIGTLAIMMLAIAAALAERRQSMLEVRSANRAKDRFLAMLGHELRNPLQAISSAAALLNQPSLPSRGAREATEIIQRQTGHLTRLVNDLLDVTRMIEGKSRLVLEPVDLADIVRRCVAALTSSRHQIDVRLESGWVQGDPDRLTQVVMNLLANALKYTPDDGAIRVWVSSTGTECLLRVEDSGVGIDPELLPHIFDPFIQGDQELDRSRGGLGLGLTLVRGLVELHGGQIEARSNGIGLGSAFLVRLPAVTTPAPALDPEASPQDGTIEHPGRRVLIVEDNRDAREALRALLESLGHVVYEAGDGKAGLETALRERPEVALVDLGLPELDGYGVARELRARGQMLRLIAVSGYGQPRDLLETSQAGFDEHLVKPVALADLLKALNAPARGNPVT